MLHESYMFNKPEKIGVQYHVLNRLQCNGSYQPCLMAMLLSDLVASQDVRSSRKLLDA